MSESDYDSADEYTSLMDGHVAESRTDDLILVNERRKGRSRISSEEVIFPAVFPVLCSTCILFEFLLRFPFSGNPGCDKNCNETNV